MPLVRAYVGPGFYGTPQQLWYICAEIIPAGMNSAMAPLTPGSIEFFCKRVEFGMNVDVVLDIEAYRTDDRQKNIEVRAADIKRALKEVLPNNTYGVWSKLVLAGWASDTSDAVFTGSMSMANAVMRAKRALANS